jgi:Flp pilus assembly protein TadG
MLKLIRRGKKDGKGQAEEGQALVEFTLLVPIFLILVFAIVDFGMGFYSWMSVTNGAREGARLGAVLATQEEIEAQVYEAVDLPDEDTKMTVVVTNAEGDPGESVVVQVDYDYDLVTPLAGLLDFATGGSIGPTITFTSRAEMRLE